MDKFTLKPLSKNAIPSALAKAERYRLLNEPGQAESICLDVLRIDPDNADARAILLLSITDQFPHDMAATLVARATELALEFSGAYERAYYDGIVRERRARAVLQGYKYGAAAAATEWLREAMECYERAEAVRPAHNDDAVLRWNACARMLMQLPERVADLNEPEPVQLE
jgi:hypothetical protein